jgi:hypothetical protein
MQQPLYAVLCTERTACLHAQTCFVCTTYTPLLLLQVQRLRLRLRMEESARAMLQRSRLAQQLQQQNAADDCDLQEDEHDGYSAPAHGQEVCI